MMNVIVVSSSGAFSPAATRPARTSRVTGRNSAPARTVPTGWRRNTNRVTTPKLPPPPRTAQKRSGLRCSLAVTIRPSAVTSSTETRLSIVRPCLRTSQPIPPPSVRPASPTLPVSPNGVASPWAAAAVVYSPAVRPGWAQARRRSGSMWRPFIAERSTTRPPSVALWMLWPPARTASSRPWSAANVTARATSAASAARTISDGFRSISVLWMWRASSYASSSGRITVPETLATSESMSIGVTGEEAAGSWGGGAGRSAATRAPSRLGSE